MLGYLSADIICSEKGMVFRERSSRKTVSFHAKWRLLRLLSFKSFSQHAPFWKLKSVLGIFGHVTWLDQSRASENIQCIIILIIYIIEYLYISFIKSKCPQPIDCHYAFPRYALGEHNLTNHKRDLANLLTNQEQNQNQSYLTYRYFPALCASCMEVFPRLATAVDFALNLVSQQSCQKLLYNEQFESGFSFI